jgi:hypothetical protein
MAWCGILGVRKPLNLSFFLDGEMRRGEPAVVQETKYESSSPLSLSYLGEADRTRSLKLQQRGVLVVLDFFSLFCRAKDFSDLENLKKQQQ